jgi:hypothetical protein
MSERKRLSCTWPAYGILNAYGEPWTPRTFGTQGAAQAYLDNSDFKTAKHRVVPVRVTVRVIQQKKRKP